MTNEEAISRIKEHMIIHKMNEPHAILITEALNMAIEALEQEPKVGHLEWMPYNSDPLIGKWYCSECNETLVGPSFKAFGVAYLYEHCHYCPNCGIKMEVKNNECKTES